AFVADPGVQGIERLHVIELVRLDMGLAQRRHPEVHERVLQRSIAETAVRHMRAGWRLGRCGLRGWLGSCGAFGSAHQSTPMGIRARPSRSVRELGSAGATHLTETGDIKMSDSVLA